MSHIPTLLVQDVCTLWGWECQLAGPHCVGDGDVADHRWNRGMGGNPRANMPQNLVCACRLCNGDKESDPNFRAQCIRRGLAVPTRYPDHGLSLTSTAITDHMLQLLTEIPVVDRHGTTWLLNADGTRTRI